MNDQGAFYEVIDFETGEIYVIKGTKVDAKNWLLENPKFKLSQKFAFDAVVNKPSKSYYGGDEGYLAYEIWVERA